MNPSTADILKAIEEVNAEHVYVLPNNKNIILAANQAKALTDNRCTVHVIPTRTIPQGITALVSFVREDTPENNEASMTEAIQNVKTAEITYAVRDTSIDGRRICQGDVISIGDHGLLSCGKDLKEVILESVAAMADDMSELVTVYTGSTFPEELRDAALEFAHHDDLGKIIVLNSLIEAVRQSHEQDGQKERLVGSVFFVYPRKFHCFFFPSAFAFVFFFGA